MSDEVYIVSACRTPIGNFLGAFSNVPAHELGAIVIAEALKRAKIDPENVNEVVMGQALTAGQGQNPARQAALKAGINKSVPAFGISMLCGSGLKAVYLAWQAIKSGEANIVVAGGQESMSMAQHTCYIRQGTKLGPPQFNDSILVDGLTDVFVQMHMGDTAELLAQKYKISRIEQDKFAFNSQKKTEIAMEMGHFDKEIVPVPVTVGKQNITVDEDEFPKKNTTLESLSKLRPVFKGGMERTVTAGNASGINDGAAALLLVSEEELSNLKCEPIVKIIGFGQCGIEPEEMGLGPIGAVKDLLIKVGWTIEDVDLFELNEAFASQSIICQNELSIPNEKLDVTGGAIALGHPIGCSGARVLVTLIHNMERLKKNKGVAALCIGGGMGIAIAVELVEN